MSAPDPAVIAALRASLASDPDNRAVRLHLAGLLADSAPADALAEAEYLLTTRPDDVDALGIAGAAAAAIGQAERAAGYRRLAAALGSTRPATAASAAAVPDTADELLRDWAEVEAPVEPEIGELSAPGVRLADVGGMDEVKRRLDLSFLAPMRNPELSAAFGKTARGGLLLWGPPGCGKTYLARALAGELGARFYSVGLSDVLDMWIGSSERNISQIFAVAREHAPCVLFFDEIDALGHQRAQLRGGGSAMRGVVNQLLAELDGATTDNAGVFVLGATNHPWDVDSALLRPGRFDRSLFVAPPDRDARRAIFALALRARPTHGVDVDKLAKATDGRSGADLALICDHAAERAMQASLSRGSIQPITHDDLADGVAAVRGSIRSWLDHARNYAQFSNESGAYDELAEYLSRKRR